MDLYHYLYLFFQFDFLKHELMEIYEMNMEKNIFKELLKEIVQIVENYNTL
jgi:hypothetical protein